MLFIHKLTTTPQNFFVIFVINKSSTHFKVKRKLYTVFNFSVSNKSEKCFYIQLLLLKLRSTSYSQYKPSCSVTALRGLLQNIRDQAHHEDQGKPHKVREAEELNTKTHHAFQIFFKYNFANHTFYSTLQLSASFLLLIQIKL